MFDSDGAYEAPSKIESNKTMTVAIEGISGKFAGRELLIDKQSIFILTRVIPFQPQVMTGVGVGTSSSPILIHDSEDEIIQELTYQQFYGSSAFGTNDTGLTHSTRAVSVYYILFSDLIPFLADKTYGMTGKRKSREGDELAGETLLSSTSLGNRLSLPESKKWRKRRKRIEREVLERHHSQSAGWIDKPGTNPPTPGPSREALTWQAKMDSGRQDLDEVLRLESEADVMFKENGPPPHSPSSPTFESDWVSSMVIAGEFSHCKKVTTATSTKLAPPSAPNPSPTYLSTSASTEILPPIHIRHDLVFSAEPPAPIRPPSQGPPQTTEAGSQPPPPFSQTIGMRPEQDPNNRHGIFRITIDTKEGGAGMNTRKDPYTPTPSQTLVMEQLPKSHRSLHFIDQWCRSACGILPTHVFVDPPSATALIEFPSADLARKAWASPRLGQHLMGTKTHLLKGKAREDLIKVWWYRSDRESVSSGLRELEEGEIEEGGGTGKQTQAAGEMPRKETKRQRKARMAKEKETKMNESPQRGDLALQNTISQSVPPAVVSTPAQALASTSQVLPPPLPPTPTTMFPFDSILNALCPSAASWPFSFAQSLPQAQSLTNPYGPITSSYSTSQTAVGSSLALGALGDSAFIASSAGGSSPHHQGKTAIVAAPSKIAVVATTVGQADDLADYSEVDIDVDNKVVATSTSPSAWKKLPPTQPRSFRPYPLPTRLHLPAKPSNISGKPGEEARSKQPGRTEPSQPHGRAAVPPLVSNNHSLRQPQEGSLSSASSTPSFPVYRSTQRTSVPSIPSKPSTISSAHTNKTWTSSESKVATNAKISKHGELDQTELSERNSRGKTAATNDKTTRLAMQTTSVPVSAVSASVAAKSSSGDSVERAMEANLRKLVFASKHSRSSGVQPHSSSSQLGASTSTIPKPASLAHDCTAREVVRIDDAPERTHENGKARMANAIETPGFVLSSATISPTSSTTPLVQSTSDTFSFEDLAVTFITQTIENVKNNKQQPRPPSVNPLSDSNLPSASDAHLSANPSLTTHSTVGSSTRPPASEGVVDDKLPLPSNSSAKLFKFELSEKHRRLEKHLQESKSLMERISSAKTKREKELLLKVMSEKLRWVFVSKTFFDLLVYIFRLFFFLPCYDLSRMDG